MSLDGIWEAGRNESTVACRSGCAHAHVSAHIGTLGRAQPSCVACGYRFCPSLPKTALTVAKPDRETSPTSSFSDRRHLSGISLFSHCIAFAFLPAPEPENPRWGLPTWPPIILPVSETTFFSVLCLPLAECRFLPDLNLWSLRWGDTLLLYYIFNTPPSKGTMGTKTQYHWDRRWSLLMRILV